MESAREVLTEVGNAGHEAVTAAERAVDREIEAYSADADDERPLRSYGALMAAYSAGVAAVMLYGRRKRVSVPERIGFGDLALISVATHRVARLLTRAAVTSVVRAPFTRFVEPAGEGEVNEEVRGTGLRHAAGELITCPFCLAQWIGTAFVAGLVLAPRSTRLAASVFTVVAVSDALQLGYATIRPSE